MNIKAGGEGGASRAKLRRSVDGLYKRGQSPLSCCEAGANSHTYSNISSAAYLSLRGTLQHDSNGYSGDGNLDARSNMSPERNRMQNGDFSVSLFSFRRARVHTRLPRRGVWR